MKERLKFARDSRDKSQEWLGKELGLTQSSVSLWERGIHLPNSKQLMQIANALNVNYQWLATGEGEMLNTDVHPAEVIEVPAKPKLEPDQFDQVVVFLNLFNQLPLSKRKALIDFMRAWVNT